MTGSQLIELERHRQISELGWTPEYDSKYEEDDALMEAAGAYLMASYGNEDFVDMASYCWPWPDYPFSPSDKVRNLVKAGALIAAQIDLLQSQKEFNNADDA